jgi:alkaline phosphatase D
VTRFTSGCGSSITGRTRTLPRPTADPERLKFAYISCQHYAHGNYHALDAISKMDDLDFVVHLGDSVYEYGVETDYILDPPTHIHEPATDIVSLSDYRTR